MRSYTKQRAQQAGFTLVELLAVVVITGLLSIAGVTIFRKYIFSAKGGEALSVIQAIRSAEEAYQAENHIYLNVSVSGTTYPSATPGAQRTSWAGGTSHPDFRNWQSLAPSVNRPVQFGYLVNAGESGTAIPAGLVLVANAPAFPIPTQNWYVIQAAGDTDGDGVYARFASTSGMTGEIYSELDGE